MILKQENDDIKLVVDLIMLLETNQIPASIVLAALNIVQRDYQRKVHSESAVAKTDKLTPA